MSKQTKDKEEDKRAAEIEQMVCDALLERPISFKTSDGRFYYIYQPSLGIQMLAEPILRNLDIDKQFLEVNSLYEMTRVITTKRNDVLRLLAYHSFKRRSDASIEELVEKRIKEFDEIIDTADLLTLFNYITSWSLWATKIQEHYRMNEDREEKDRVMQELSKKGGLTYGGRSIYGRLIDFACQRYGWQVGYVVWGVSLTNLNVMMADAITTIQMTKDEMNKIGVSNDRDVIKADDPANKQRIIELLRRT